MGNAPYSEEVMAKPQSSSYALSGKIMLTAIVILLFVIILMIFLHIYARWYLIRARRRHIRTRNRNRNRNRRTQLVFYVDTNTTAPAFVTTGLDQALLKSLPIFTFTQDTHPDLLDCPVCLSEFEENEAGRVLPKCHHSFHLDCIDMWFQSHSTCPLCRTPVEPGPVTENPNPVDVTLNISDQDSRSEMFQQDDGDNQVGTSTSTSSCSSSRRKSMAIQLPKRNHQDRVENGCESPLKSPLKSPMSRILSLKRMLSREMRYSPTPSPRYLPTSCGEPDIERGKDQSQ